MPSDQGPGRHTIDARRAFCPGPMMELIGALRASAIGEEIEVMSSDRGAARDIPVWTAKVGHVLVASDDRGDHHAFIVRKSR